MADHTKQYPTQGALAREQLRRRGLPYFRDVNEEVKTRLARLPVPARQAFSLACATRALRMDERLPPPLQSSHAAELRPLLDALWKGLGAEGEAARVLGRFRPLLARLQASDELTAASPTLLTTLYLADCCARGDVASASGAGSTAVDAAFRIADQELQLDPNVFVWDPAAEPMPLAQEAMHPAVQGELAEQRAALALLESEGATQEALVRLRG